MSHLIILLILAAFALDFFLGDPHSWPHPVRLIGAALSRLEPLGQALPDVLKRAFGLAVVLALGCSAYAVVSLLTGIPHVGWLFWLYFAYSGLALGQLLRETRNVARLIDAGDLDAARREVGMLVSRDTSCLDEASLRRTLAETLSENFCDAFVAPAFYLALGGPALLWFYKAVSTMDSMWGYKTERYRLIGWAGARADDVLAFVPARLAYLLLLAAGWSRGLPAGEAWRSAPAQARAMASPNAGWPMAAAAWLCGAGMGGRAVYFGQVVDKPQIGPIRFQWSSKQVNMLFRLVMLAGCYMVLVTICITYMAIMLFS